MTPTRNAPRNILLSFLLAMTFAEAIEAFDLTFFSPDDFSEDTEAMDAHFGVTGYLIEDFEDPDLVPGLLIHYSETVPCETVSVLPNLLEPVSQPWDGIRVVGNSPTNEFMGNSKAYAQRIEFLFASPVLSVGVGLAGFQSESTMPFPITDHLLLINGETIGTTLEELASEVWVPSLSERNAYLRIDAGPGEVIHSIGFENIGDTPETEDFIELDHLAISPAPALFTDGFESGTTSVWSATVP